MEEKKNNDPQSWSEFYQMISENSNALASEMLRDNDLKDQRKNRIISYLIGVICLLIVGLVGSNLYWIHQWNSYDYYSQDGDGVNSINTGSQSEVDYEPKTEG